MQVKHKQSMFIKYQVNESFHKYATKKELCVIE